MSLLCLCILSLSVKFHYWYCDIGLVRVSLYCMSSQFCIWRITLHPMVWSILLILVHGQIDGCLLRSPAFSFLDPVTTLIIPTHNDANVTIKKFLIGMFYQNIIYFSNSSIIQQTFYAAFFLCVELCMCACVNCALLIMYYLEKAEESWSMRFWINFQRHIKTIMEQEHRQYDSCGNIVCLPHLQT